MTGETISVMFIEHDGRERHVLLPVGANLMAAALGAGVANIIGECGGGCSCGTCHVYLGEEWREKVTPISETEDDMLSLTSCRDEQRSRLACQIVLTPEHDQLRVALPEQQG